MSFYCTSQEIRFHWGKKFLIKNNTPVIIGNKILVNGRILKWKYNCRKVKKRWCIGILKLNPTHEKL